MSKTKNSIYALWLIIAGIILIGFFFYPKWEKSGTEGIISWDAAGYYVYLPSAFIYHDLGDIKTTEQKAKEYHTGFEAFPTPKGTKITKYAIGQSILFIPAFWLAHILAEPFGYPADGFSYPYQLAIGVWGLLVNILGFILLRKLLLRHFKDSAVAIVLFIIYFATNYLNQNTIENAYTHNHLFTLYAILFLLSENYYKHPRLKTGIAIGLTVGLMTLIRPTELISILIPLFWLVDQKRIKERIQFLWAHFSHLIMATILVILIGSIQLTYWKYATGDWIYYSYGDQGFDFLSPHFYNCIFTFKKGWWVYTPIMSLIVPGFFLLSKRKTLFLPSLIYSLLFMYIVFSWQVWWYGGSMSQRSVVQLYVLLAFPLAALTEYILSRSRWIKGVFFAAIIFCTYYNFWLTYQAHYGGQLHPERMNRYYFRKVFLRTKADINHKALLDNKDYYERPILNSTEIYFNDFEQDSISICPDAPLSGEKSFCLSKKGAHFPVVALTVPKDKKWLRASAKIQLRPKEWNDWSATQFVLQYKNKGQDVKTNLIRLDYLIEGDGPKTLHLDSKIPTKPFDEVKLFFLSYSDHSTAAIDDLKVIVFDE